METKRKALGKGLEELFNNENINFSDVEKEIVDEEAFDYMKVYHSIIIDDADNVTSYDLVLGSKENVITYPVFAVSYVLG